MHLGVHDLIFYYYVLTSKINVPNVTYVEDVGCIIINVIWINNNFINVLCTYLKESDNRPYIDHRIRIKEVDLE